MLLLLRFVEQLRRFPTTFHVSEATGSAGRVLLSPTLTTPDQRTAAVAGAGMQCRGGGGRVHRVIAPHAHCTWASTLQREHACDSRGVEDVYGV